PGQGYDRRRVTGERDDARPHATAAFSDVLIVSAHFRCFESSCSLLGSCTTTYSASMRRCSAPTTPPPPVPGGRLRSLRLSHHTRTEMAMAATTATVNAAASTTAPITTAPISAAPSTISPRI